MEASAGIKLEGLIRIALAKIELYQRAADTPADILEKKLMRIKEKQKELKALSDNVQSVARRDSERLVEDIRLQLNRQLSVMYPKLEEAIDQFRQDNMEASSHRFEAGLLAETERIMEESLAFLNQEGLEALNKGYAAIVASLSEKAEAIASFLSEAIKDQFDLDYPVLSKTTPLSDRSDYYVQVNLSKTRYLNTESYVHLLPRKQANTTLYKRAKIQLSEGMDHNRNNMVYNYRYKMQESLRRLCMEFSGDIDQMRREIDQLLSHVTHRHVLHLQEQNSEIRKYTSLADGLMRISEGNFLESTQHKKPQGGMKDKAE